MVGKTKPSVGGRDDPRPPFPRDMYDVIGCGTAPSNRKCSKEEEENRHKPKPLLQEKVLTVFCCFYTPICSYRDLMIVPHHYNIITSYNMLTIRCECTSFMRVTKPKTVITEKKIKLPIFFVLGKAIVNSICHVNKIYFTTFSLNTLFSFLQKKTDCNFRVTSYSI